MKKNILTTFILVFSLLAIPAQAQEFAPVGTAVAQFLEIGMGARGTALGEAYTTITDDAGSVFWNPAGIVKVDGNNFLLAYNRWPADIGIGGLSYAHNLGVWGSVAIHATYLMTDDMDVTTIEQPNGTGETFGISNYALGITYARYLTNRLAIGLTAKLVQEKYYEHGYNSVAFDFGTLYKTDYHGLTFGMSIMHFGPEVNFDKTYIDYSDPESYSANNPRTFKNYSLPVNFRVGISFDVYNTGPNRVISTTDMVHPNNNLEQYNWGLEYGYKRIFFFRTGYKFRADEGGLTLGAGVQYPFMGDAKAAIDYSFAEVGIITDIHRFSVSLSF